MSTQVEQVLNRLTASIRGQIFLCNLSAGLDSSAIDPIAVRDIFDRIGAVLGVDSMHEDDLLGALRDHIRRMRPDHSVRNDRSAHFDHFSDGDALLSVMRAVDFSTYYADSMTTISGHDSSPARPGSSTRNYRSIASTTVMTWVAPRRAFTDPGITEKDAEGVRDQLGLVHYGRGVALVAMHFYPTVKNCYRPTVFEAVPNARFRYISPQTSSESRWGYTVNLASLDSVEIGDDIKGTPELTMRAVAIADCNDVEFFQLGKTSTDKDTASADGIFLSHLLVEKNISAYVNNIISYITP